MFKQLFMLVVIVSAFNAHATALDGCVNRILEVEQWKALTPAALECLHVDGAFLATADQLCMGEDFSDFFKIYLDYSVKAREAALRVLETPDPVARKTAHADWVRIEQEWKTLGYQPLIDQHLLRLMLAKNRCLDAGGTVSN